MSEPTARKWVARASAGKSLEDRSSRPHRSPTQLPKRLVEAIEKLRRMRMTASAITEILGLALSTVSLWLKRIGLGKRSRLEPPEPPTAMSAVTPASSIRIQPYRPRTNGKAERFIQSLLRESAYSRLYGSSAERLGQLESWLTHCNFNRPHGSLGHRAPATRLNNLVGNYT